MSKNSAKNTAAILKNIVMLEASGVGCDSTCLCRAMLATTLTADQSAQLEVHAKGVVFDHKPSDIGAIKEMFGDSLSATQVEIVDHIAKDSADSPDKDVKGGAIGAIIALGMLSSLPRMPMPADDGKMASEQHEARAGEPAFA